MVPSKGVYQFVFPNIVGPRFTEGNEDWVCQSIMDSTVVSATDLTISLKINAGMPVTATCKSHNANFEYSGNSAQTQIETKPGDDFIVDYTLFGNQITTGLLLYEGEEENFFLSIIQPPPPVRDYPSPKRE